MATDFATKYTNANIDQDATQYDSELFVRLHTKLANALSSEKLSIGVLVSLLFLLSVGFWS